MPAMFVGATTLSQACQAGRATSTRAARTGVLTASGDSPAASQPGDPETVRALGGEAFSVVDDTGGRVLIPVVRPEGTTVVRATVTPEDLRSGVVVAWAGIAGLGALLLAVALAIAWWLGRRISEPLLEVAARHTGCARAI